MTALPKEGIGMRGNAAKVEEDMYQLMETGLFNPFEAVVRVTTGKDVRFVRYCGMLLISCIVEIVLRSDQLQGQTVLLADFWHSRRLIAGSNHCKTCK